MSDLIHILSGVFAVLYYGHIFPMIPMHILNYMLYVLWKWNIHPVDDAFSISMNVQFVFQRIKFEVVI